MKRYLYEVKRIVKIQDGDTVTLEVDLGFKITVTQKFRLMDFDAPETWRPKTEEEREAGHRVKEYLTELLNAEGGLLMIESSNIGTYGRYDGRLWRFQFTDDNELVQPEFSINAQVIDYMQREKLRKSDVR